MSKVPIKEKLAHSKGKLLEQLLLISTGIFAGCVMGFVLFYLGFLTEDGSIYVGLLIELGGVGVSQINFNNHRRLKPIFVSILITLGLIILVVGAHTMSHDPSNVIEPNDPSNVIESNDPSISMQTPTPTPEETESPDNTPGPFEMTEKQSFTSVGTIESDSNANGKYVPKLSTEEEAYLFLDNQTFLHHGEDVPLTDSELYELIHERYYAAYHSVENFSAEKVNGDPKLSSLILGAEDIDKQIKQAIATNRLSDLAEFYDELLQIYQTAASEAPRGEYFLQLGRPYYEKALYMKRESSKEKDEVFRLCAQAILAYRTSATYNGTLAETDADLLYRIAAIYHYLGDTPALQSEYRVRLYRLAIAYLTFASNIATSEDDYYGYIEYYKGMVLHKLAIVTTDPLDTKRYLESAKEDYLLALDQRQYNDSLLADLDHAVKDIDYRLS